MASLTKSIERLEATIWAQAERIEIAAFSEVVDILAELRPMQVPALNYACAASNKTQKREQQSSQIIESYLPIHPAFMPDEHEQIRAEQWVMHHSDDYRELQEQYWRDVLEIMRSHFEGKDAIGAAFIVYERGIDKEVAQAEYIGYPLNREEIALTHVEYWRILTRIHRAGEKDDQAWIEDQKRANRELDAVICGRRTTEEDQALDERMWEQLNRDMESGKPSSESEAARYFLAIHEKYPRKPQFRRPAE